MDFRSISLALGLILGIVRPALAQSPIQFVSSTVHVGQPVPQACQAEARVLQSKLALYPQRQGWTNVIVCDEPAWQNAFAQRGNNSFLVGNYFVKIGEHKSVFNGADYPGPKIKEAGGKWAVATAPALPAPLPVPPSLPAAGALYAKGVHCSP